MRTLAIVPLFLVVCVLMGALVRAQSSDETPAFGALLTQPPTLMPTWTPKPPDSRTAVCAAPTLPGFHPHIVRPGDRLDDLLTVDNLTVTQLATLNCLDDPDALPVGATIWIPGSDSSDLATPETTPTLAESAAILRLEMTPLGGDGSVILNQEGATVSWRALGESVYFYPCPADTSADCARPVAAPSLPEEYELTIANFQHAGTFHYRLEANGSGETVVEDVVFEVVCSQQWLAPMDGTQRCPNEAPRAVFGVWQPFEGGVMLWFSDTRAVYVMTNADHRVRVVQDMYIEGAEEPAIPDIPEERYAPIRGFGLVWRELGAQDSPLGWALASEIGYDAARQPAGRVSYTTYIQGPGATVYAVTFMPDSDEGYWQQVAG